MVPTSEIDTAVFSLEQRCFRSVYKPKTWDDNSFYRIVSSVKWGSFDHPKSARKGIGKIQLEKDHQLFFLAFEPSYQFYAEGKVVPEAILKADLNNGKESRAAPTRRDIYAAAEFLQRSIHIIYWDRSCVQKEIFDPPFTSYETDEIIYILSVSQQDQTAFVQLEPNGDTDVDTAEHSQCQGQAFRRSFVRQLHIEEQAHTKQEDDSRMVDRSVTNDKTKGLFYSLSKAMYGSDIYHEYVRQLIVKCLRDDVLAEVFLDNTNDEEGIQNASPKEKERSLNDKRSAHISALKEGRNVPGKTELYAAASLFRTQIFVKGKTSESWDDYYPLSVSRKARPRSSYITLSADMRLLIPINEECNCLRRPPPVEYLESINSDKLKYLAYRFVVEKRDRLCCTGGRHGRHTHLDSFCKSNIAKEKYTRHCVDFPDDIEIEGRTLDKITEDHATFRQCIHKLIYGTDDVSDDFTEVRKETPDDAYLREIASWLNMTIYIYSLLSRTWKVLEPNTPPQTDSTTKPCRYYITLFHDDTIDRYDIITPERGCNCTMRPPAVVYTSQTETTRLIPKDDRHNPLTEFFLDVHISDNSFSEEIQNIMSREGYSQIHEVFQRPDMQAREVDKGQTEHSLYTCLSKEIFGNEEQAKKIEELVAREMLHNVELYASLLGVKSTLKSSKFSLSNEVNKQLLPFLPSYGHIPLFAASTLFQTPIYLLKVEKKIHEENEWTSSWSLFSQVERKSAPAKMPTLQSRCRQNGNSDRYYVTLLQDPYGNFFRVVPRKESSNNRDEIEEVKVCNCQLDHPEVPGEFVRVITRSNSDLYYLRSTHSHLPLAWHIAENEIIETFRDLDNALGQNLLHLRQMTALISTQLLMYDLIVAVFESRRRNINIASIVGGSVSTIGGVLLIVGFALAPVTAGLSLGLSVAGGITSGLGSASVIGAKVTEGALTKYQLHVLVVIHELLDVLSIEADKSNKTFLNKAQKVITSLERGSGELRDTNADIVLGISLALRRLLSGFHIFTLILARLSLRVSSQILGSVVGGVSVLIDAAITAYAVYNLNKGNKTATSEMIRKNADVVRALKMKLESYIHGKVN